MLADYYSTLPESKDGNNILVACSATHRKLELFISDRDFTRVTDKGTKQESYFNCFSSLYSYSIREIVVLERNCDTYFPLSPLICIEKLAVNAI
jgi:hypothetical protein